MFIHVCAPMGISRFKSSKANAYIDYVKTYAKLKEFHFTLKN